MLNFSDSFYEKVKKFPAKFDILDIFVSLNKYCKYRYFLLRDRGYINSRPFFDKRLSKEEKVIESSSDLERARVIATTNKVGIKAFCWVWYRVWYLDVGCLNLCQLTNAGSYWFWLFYGYFSISIASPLLV